MDYFFRCQKSPFNLENKKCLCPGNYFAYQVIGCTYSRIIFRAMRISFELCVYLNDISKTLKGIGKTQFVIEFIIL